MAVKLPAIPSTTKDIPKGVVDVLNPIRNILETRMLSSSSDESVVTRADLVKLGLVTADQIKTLRT